MGVNKADVKSIFGHAMSLSLPEERAAYLQQACAGDAALRAEIESLLQADREAGSFLGEREPRMIATDDDAVRERPGMLLGPYKLLEQIGEGGFGLVFMAEQQHPVRRKVALKIIKPGMDTRHVIARFEAERQALALMDHPHIARVLDAGATDSGRPFFVMELVRGVPITQFSDDNRLTLQERLELFVGVCQAVQHAHQKGIIHRDLKPSNVLVTLHDGTPVAKVIDFGIAKSLGQERLTDKTVFTSFAQLLGTPLYMSPEQAEMSGLDADTRTDIYALGVLLYELLTGTTPFAKERFKEASYEEIRRIIREEEPAKPSTRISTLGQAATTVSANRKSDPKRLSQLFRGELDWIVMKALEKDRNRRYDTASAFAADVQRYLQDEPVQACPPSTGYRLRKFARRNKVALLTASAIAVVILLAVTGLAVSTTLTWQANQELRLERGRADEKTKMARRLLYSSDLIAAQKAWEDGHLVRARELLERQRPREDEDDLRGFEWRYLWRLCRDGSLHTFSGHRGAISVVRFTRDGTMLASGGQDGSVRLWDVATHRPVLLSSHEASVTSLAFTPDDKILATACDDGTVTLWDVAARWKLITFRHEADRKQLAFTPDGKLLVSAGWSGGGIKLWDISTGRELDPITGPSSWLCISISPDGKTLAAGGNDTTVRLWDLERRHERGCLGGHRAFVIGLAFSPDGRMLVSANQDNSIKFWDMATTKELEHPQIQAFHRHRLPVQSLTFSPDGKRLATGSGDNTIRLWDTTTWQEVCTLRGHTAGIVSLEFSPDGRSLVTGSDDGTAKVWDPSAKEEPKVLPGHEGWVHSLAFSPEGKMLASAGWFDREVKLWDVAAGRQIAALTGHAGKVLAVKFSPDGQTLASAGGDKMVRLWDVATHKLLKEFVHTAPVGWISLSPDGLMLAAGSEGGSVVVWEIASRLERARFRGRNVAFASDGTNLAVGDVDGTARVWDISTRTVAATMEGSRAVLTAVAFSPDGRNLVTASEDLTVRLWNVTTQMQIDCFKGHTGTIWSVAFSPDGKTLASCSRDSTVKLWNLAVQDEAITLEGASQVASAVFSPDGNLLATAGADSKIRLWRAAPLLETDALITRAPADPKATP